MTVNYASLNGRKPEKIPMEAHSGSDVVNQSWNMGKGAKD